MVGSQYKKWVFLFLILLFPSLLYVILSTGETNFISLPHYGPKEVKTVDGEADTSYYKIKPFNLETIEGGQITLQGLDGQNKVFSFVSAAGEGSASRINAEMAQLQLEFENRKDLALVSFILTVGELGSTRLEFIKKEMKGASRTLIPVSPDIARLMATNSFLLDGFDPATGTDTLVLVDKQNHIRGYYNGMEYVEVNELIDAIKVLKAEEFIPRKP